MEGIMINNLSWEIIVTNIENFGEVDSEFGYCDNLMLKIYLRDDIPIQNLQRTLLHELTHAFLYSYGHRGDEFNEENICDFIESHLLNIYNLYNAIKDRILIEN